MLKNKFLVIAAFCFVGFSFASEPNQDESPSLTNKVKTCLKSAANSPFTALLVTFMGASLIKNVGDSISAYIPGLGSMDAIVNSLIRNKTATLKRIDFAIPTYQTVSKFSSMGLAYYASGKFFKDSDLNKTGRLMGAFAYFTKSFFK